MDSIYTRKRIQIPGKNPASTNFGFGSHQYFEVLQNLILAIIPERAYSEKPRLQIDFRILIRNILYTSSLRSGDNYKFAPFCLPDISVKLWRPGMMDRFGV